MTKELAIRIITGDVLGTSEQTQEAVTMAVKALSMSDVPDKNVGGTISRQAAIDAIVNSVSEIGLHDNSEVARYGATFRQHEIIDIIEGLPSAQPEIIHCKYCIYYDPEHVEKDGVRYEYSDMPKDAFDILGTNLVNSKYGVNVGGRCCRDYNVGYPEDKRVFVSEQNFCGRAERKEE
jgi:hypothetical protein